MRRSVRYLVWAIGIVALGLRLVFVLTTPDRALFWDEPHYHHVATDYLRIFGGTSIRLHPPAGVPWQTPQPTLADAVRVAMFKGELYTATVALMYALFGDQPRAVFVLQALLDTVTCLLLFGLARAIGGVRAGLIALVFAALYEPFIFSTARLQTESFASLLYVGALWAMCVPARGRVGGSFWAGMLIAGAMLTRPAMQGLFVPLLPAVLVRNWDRAWRARLLALLAFATGFFVLVGPRLLLTQELVGTPLWSGKLKAGADMYAGILFANVGWMTDDVAYADPPRGELLAVMGDPPTRPPRQNDMREAALRTWRLHPIESVVVTLHKAYAAWLHPYNDARWSFLTGMAGQEVSHRLLLALALIGMPLSLRRWRVAVALLVTTLYLWLPYLAVKIEVRYVVSTMPMMICFAGVTLAVLSRGAELAWRGGRRRRLVMLAGITVAGLGAATTMSVARLLQWLPLTPEGADGLRMSIVVGLIVWLAYVAAELATPWWRRSTTMTLLGPSMVIAALVVLVGRPLAQDWREWHVTLAPSRGIVRQEFILPAPVEPPQSASLSFDLLPGPTSHCDVVVRINGEIIKRYRDGVARGDADLSKYTLYRTVSAARERTQTADRAWYRVPIPAALITPGNRLTVELALEGDCGPRDSLAIFGDYSPNSAQYAVPSLFSPTLSADTSALKYLADGDFRMRRTIQLAGSSRSRFYDGSAWAERDLGLDPGRQSGRYRIFLVLTYPNGTTIL